MSRPCVSLWGTIRRKYMGCATVCPVDCFYEGENMLVIHPDECIDCGVCEPKCPAAAIIPDSDQRAAGWIAHNARYAVPWPNISIAKTPPSDAREFDGRPNKLRGYLSEKPGGIDA